VINAEAAKIIRAESAEKNRERLNAISGQIINAALRVHTVLGPWLLESAYEVCFAHELRKRGLHVEKQFPLPVTYDGVHVDLGYRLDLLVENEVVVELKAIETVLPVHKAQLLSYLRLGEKKLGLLINFHVERLKDGITRLVNKF
jgi:GxxExxY protein